MHWKYDMDEQKWVIARKAQLQPCTCATINYEKQVIALGVEGGYALYKLDDFSKIHDLNITKTAYTTSVALNSTGDWLALAAASTGQLLIWDWNAQTCKSNVTNYLYLYRFIKTTKP